MLATSYFLQAQSPPVKYNFALHGFVGPNGDISNSVKLRWGPMDVYSWIAGNTYGYKLSRYVLKSGGVRNEPDDILKSEVVLIDNVKPLSKEDWVEKIDTNNTSANYPAIAAGAIYGDTFEIENLSNNPAIKSFNQIKVMESRFSYCLLAADMDFSVATDLGLAYEDTNLTSGEEYLYTLTLSDEADPNLVENSGAFIAKADSVYVLNPVDSLGAYPADKSVVLTWAVPFHDPYIAYNVEKSTDNGQSFTKINDIPVVMLQSEQKGAISFTDSLPDNSTIIVYRVIGLNSFGMQGPASDTIQVKGKPSRLSCYALITSTEESLTNQMTIHWQLQQVTDINQIQELNVYRSHTHSGTFVKLNAQPLPPSQQQFVDSFPAVTNYYRVQIIDINGYTYESIHSLAQHADSIPPSAPVSLSGVCDKTGLVKLKWSKNTEEDLLGYRVYLSNFADSFYVQITSSIARDSYYYYTTNLNTLTKKLYFRVTAEDNRHNVSTMSSTCEITRPDIVPPANPILFNASANPSGIELAFVCSPSDDVSITKLQKRKKGARIWATIYSINGVQLAGNTYAFVDTNVTYEYIYQYRALSYDESGNYSSSKIIELRGYDSGIRGNISNVEVTKVNFNNINNTTSNPNAIPLYPNTVNIVQWSYADTVGIYNFQIYRSFDNEPFRILDVVYLPQDTIREPQQIRSYINTSKFWYVDMKMLSKYGIGNNPNGGTSGGNNNGGTGGNSGGGQQGGGNNTGGQGGTNTNGSHTYKYKILANHRDGGTSRLSSDVNIAVN